MPIYIEVRGLGIFPDTTGCRTNHWGRLVMVSYGGMSCGGTWESIGPLDLGPWGVQTGERYLIQAVFFERLPSEFGPGSHSPGLSCIRVESHARRAR
jgi:hypothetical protein